MKVLSLFDGMSCCHIALDRVGIRVDEYYASEIKDIAIKVTQQNYPDTIQIGDVNKVSYKDGILYTEKGDFNVDHIDLLAFGSPCFEAGTKIITKNGYKNIEDIRVGDEVLTHTKQYQKVLRTGGKISDTVELKCQGMIPTRVTLNHPYYVRHMKCVGHDGHRSWSDPKWVQVKDLKKDDFIGYPIITTEENHYNLTEEDCWLLGRYVADGHYRRDKRKGRINSYQNQVILSIGKDKLEDFKKHIKSRHFSCYPHSQSVYRCVFSSEELVKFLIDHRFGKGAENKRIPEVILNLPINLANKFLDGYLSGDGHYVKDKDYYTCNTVSKELALGLEMLIMKCKNVNCGVLYHKVAPTTIIEGRVVNQKPAYYLQFRDGIRKQSNAFIEDGYVWCRFNGYDKLQINKAVYNLEVENDNSYTANNVIVHNCNSFSVAMKTDMRIGLEDMTRSGLFLEAYRILKEVQPTYFFLENVKSMKKDDKDFITKCMGVEPIMIDGALVGPAYRRRYYWTNIPNVSQPKDKSITLQSILTDGYTDRQKARNLLVSDSRPLTTPVKMFHRYYSTGFTTLIFKDEQHYKDCVTEYERLSGGKRKLTAKELDDYDGHIFDGVRYLNQEEIEKCHGVPKGYTKCLTRNQCADVVGDGWEIDVIAHIFSFINTQQNDLENKEVI